MRKQSHDPVIQSVMGDYLQMPYNRYLWLRLEFVEICKDEIEAKIMRIVEYDIEGARNAWFNNASALAANGKPYPPAPEQWWVTLSYRQIMYKMYGTVKNEKTIIAKLDSLLNKKHYLQKRANPENPYGAPQYTINKEVVQEKLDSLPQLPMVPNVGKIYGENKSDPVPANGTPPSGDDPYQLMVPPVPANGTPGTSHWNSPVPANGTEGYQPLVHINNSKNIKETKEDKEESIANDSAVELLAPSVAPSSPSLSPSLFSEEEEKKPKEKTPSKKKEKKAEPIMPPQDAPWPSRETAVQIVEAKKGRIYSDTTRKQELGEAGKILEMTVDNAPITRDQFESAWDDLASSSWWDEHGKPCMIKYLRRDDTIVGIVKKLKRRATPSSNTQAQIVDIDAEREKMRQKSDRNLENLLERKRKRELAEQLATQGAKNG